MEEKNTSDFKQVSVHLRKDFQMENAQAMPDPDPLFVLDLLEHCLDGVDTELYCILEFDLKYRLIRERNYPGYLFQNTLDDPEQLMRQLILDGSSIVVVTHLTDYVFPTYPTDDETYIRKEAAVMRKAGQLFSGAGIHMQDYILSDFHMRRYLSFLQEEILRWPAEKLAQYPDQVSSLWGKTKEADPVPQRNYDNRYPAKLSPSFCYPGSVKTPEDAILAVRELIQDSDREILGVINLSGWKPLNFFVAAVGNSNQVGVNPGLMLRSTLLSNANSVILFHNHPGGSLVPSAEDCAITDRMQRLCETCGITMMDHVIIGFNTPNCYSFFRRGVFDAEHGESPYEKTENFLRRMEKLFQESGKESEQSASRNNTGSIAAEKPVSAHRTALPRR